MVVRVDFGIVSVHELHCVLRDFWCILFLVPAFAALPHVFSAAVRCCLLSRSVFTSGAKHEESQAVAAAQPVPRRLLE